MALFTGIVLVLMLVPASLGAATEAGAVAVYPLRAGNMRFDHFMHRKIPCLSCHAATAMKVRVTQPSIPGHENCAGCHKQADDSRGLSADCEKCHVGTPREAVRKWPSLNFSHAAHAAIKGGCKACHEPFGSAPYPRFEKCESCHETLVRQGRCLTCHPGSNAGRLELDVVGGKLLPKGGHGGADHGTGWMHGHGNVARHASEACYKCHRQKHCDRCHRGVLRPIRHHPADWEVLHGQIARADSHRCVACHRTQTSCLKCHERTGMSPDSRSSPVNRRVHPEGFGLGGRHGAEARRNLKRCTSCHTESHCISCHGARGQSMRIKPHPPGFRSRCRLMRKRNPRACKKCHAMGELEVLCP